MIGDFKRKKDFLTIEFYFDLGRVRRVKYPKKLGIFMRSISVWIKRLTIKLFRRMV